MPTSNKALDPKGVKSKPQSDTVDFLHQFVGTAGPWVLTCIAPDRKGIATRTFRANDEPEMRQWLAQYNDKRNLYFQVNPSLHDQDKKAAKTDIAEVRYLHVDIDPRAGEDLDTERARILALLGNNLPADVPAPTAVVFSGGGYQAFWRLKTPIPIGGDLAKAEAAARYNIELEQALGGDNCHDISRIMRLPGTVNIPDARKVAKGRTPIQAELVDVHEDRVYPLSAFKAAPAVSLRPSSADPASNERPGGKAVTIGEDVRRLHGIDDLPGGDDKLKILIAQGLDPDDPNKYPSRSEALFAVVCELVRASVDDEMIYAVITDEQFRISDSVLQTRNPKSYAIRQIQRAHEEHAGSWLRKLNDTHTMISRYGGKCVVLEEYFDPELQRWELETQSTTDFTKRYAGRTVNIDGNEVPIAPLWLKDKHRRQCDTVKFLPEGSNRPEVYNTWRGFACEPDPAGDCRLYLAHIRDNVCAGNDEHYEYLIRWMARAVQQPHLVGEVAVVMRGGRGVGKSFFAKYFGALWGRHFLTIADPKFLVGNFNVHLRDCSVLFADEAFYAGDKKNEGVLKTLVTGREIMIEPKGVDPSAARNSIHLIMASNSDWVVPAGPNERRYFVVDVGKGQQQNAEYFGAIENQMKAGGYGALLHMLQTMDLSDFDVRRVPHTDALRDQQERSRPLLVDWLMYLIQECQLPGGGNGSRPDRCAPGALLEDVRAFSDQPRRRTTPTALGRFLGGVGCIKGQSGDRYWEFPQPPVLRENLEKMGYHVRGDVLPSEHWLALNETPGRERPKDDLPF